MAGGMFTKQAVWLGAKFLNNVNEPNLGGLIQGLPAGVVGSQGQATQPGDRIILDDLTAFALSDNVGTGTLFGGIYQYVQTLVGATATPARGTCAFFRLADIVINGPVGTPYLVTSDAQATTALPAFFAGVFINAITKGNFGWVQVAGIASCLFDSAITATANATTVSVKVSAAVASTFDAGVAVSTTTLSFVIGYALELPVVSTITRVAITRSICRL